MRFRALLLASPVSLFALVAAADCPQLLTNNEFNSGLSSWTIEEYGDPIVVDASVSVDSYKTVDFWVDAYEPEPWLSDAGISQSGFSIVAGQQYKVTFWARASDWNTSVPASVKVGLASSPYTALGLNDVKFNIGWNGGAGNTHTFTFTATGTSSNAGLVIFFGLEDANVSVDSIFLEQTSSPSCTTGSGGSSGTGGAGTGGASTGGASASGGSVGTGGSGTGGSGGSAVTGAVVRMNQLGFVPSSEKLAIVEHTSTTPLPWTVVDGSSAVLASGTTSAIGNDPVTGKRLHQVDFSNLTTSGSGLRVRVGNAQSTPFAIGGDVYGALSRDALRFFYHQRASSAITMPYAESTAWTRALGHPDTSVPCRAGTGCSYYLNVSKGWYDAGDFGKYVVNGGISVWTLLNLYERSAKLGSGVTPLGDGKQNIPESANGKSDLLDEARWELEFLLGMQVPAGNALAGMAHHKVHGTTWPDIPTDPSTDNTGRLLSAPSTAATLNLAATAAQAARLYTSDSAFADRCLTAAEAAYAAAVANPNRYAVSGDADEDGGGAYDDNDVSDEFYWAAAELFITTGKAVYKDALLASAHHLKLPATGAPFSWNTTAGLGALSLAIATSDLTASQLDAVRAAVAQRADAYAALSVSGYGAAISDYGWGSNSDVVNAGLVLAVAYDLTGTPRYRKAALAALDSVLGRNALGQSYVTQVGVAPFKNAHHRFFAAGFAAGAGWSAPPRGFLAGGPNKKLDGVAYPGALAGCVGPLCWRDEAEAYGLTEVTVNWNAPLAWMSSWASELETNPVTSFPGITDPGPGNGTGGASNAGSGGDSGVPAGSRDGSGGSDASNLGGAGAPGDRDGGDNADTPAGCGCNNAGTPTSTGSLWVVALGLLGWRVARKRRAA